MASAVCGSDTFTIDAPSSRILSIAESHFARTSGSSESGKYSVGMPTVRPFRDSGLAEPVMSGSGGTVTSALVASNGSSPDITYVASSASRTDLAHTPIWSRDEPNATRPNRLTRPYVGFTPTTPQNAAGWRTLPPVSDPSAMFTIPAATAAAEPPDEPPGARSGSIGFRVGPYALLSVDEPIANSSMLVFATITAPLLRSLVIAVASYGLV